MSIFPDAEYLHSAYYDRQRIRPCPFENCDRKILIWETPLFNILRLILLPTAVREDKLPKRKSGALGG